MQKVPANVVIDATPVDLTRLITMNKPVVRVDYRFSDQGDILNRMLEEFETKYLARVKDTAVDRL